MMAVPPIDPRNAQDLIDEAKRRIPLYCPEWTDHNVSDPGVTLIELFAFMTDVLLYRLNKVSDRDYLKFLELIDVHPRPAVPAGTELMFWLTRAATELTRIPAGSEVATQQTEAEALVTFTTDADLTIRVPRLQYLVLARNLGGPAGYSFEDVSVQLSREDAVIQVFQEPPADPEPTALGTGTSQGGDCFYLGFSEQRGGEWVAQNLAGHVLRVALSCQRLGGSNVRAEDPPLTWEFWTGAAWANLQPSDEEGLVLARTDQELARMGRRLDGTLGLNEPGSVVLVLPRSSAPTALNIGGRRIEATWIRCRAARRYPDERFYNHSPVVTGVSVDSIGGMVPASHAAIVSNEDLGRSDGTPGQTFQLRYAPVLPRRVDGADPETLEVAEEDGTFRPWVEVESFAHSDAASNHFAIDALTGALRFGPRVQLAGGEDRQYGRVPPRGRVIRFLHYRTGGGKEGNVGRGKLSVLKSAAKLTYVKWATNPRPATGGRDQETLDEYRLRGGELVRTRDVAITRGDFVKLALEASPAVARAHCVGVSGEIAEDQAGGAEPAGDRGVGPERAGTSDVMRPRGNGARLVVRGPELAPAQPALGGARGPAATALPCIELVLVPAMVTQAALVDAEELLLSAEERRQLFKRVRDYLSERCPLTTELSIHLASYHWVSVAARLAVRRRTDLEAADLHRYRRALVDEARTRLFRFIHPVIGGPEGTGWPFGRTLTMGDIYPLLESVPGIAYVEGIQFREWVTASHALDPAPVERVRLQATDVLCSADHRIDLIEMAE